MKKIIGLFIVSAFLSAGIIDWSPDGGYSNHMTPHNESYFLFHSQLDSKLQFSVKYNLINQVYFGYTQIIFWNLMDASAPFKNLDCSPEIFYKIKFFPRRFLKYITLAPYQHKSNGKSGKDDRSVDKAVAVIQSALYFGPVCLTIDQKYFYIYKRSISSRNRDLYDYEGFQRYRAALSWDIVPGKITDAGVYLDAFAGGNQWTLDKITFSIGTKAGTQFNIPVKRNGKKEYRHVNIQSFAEYYRGYSESILVYNQFRSIYRFGFIFR